MISPCWRKTLSAFLCVAMMMSAFPVLAAAEESASQEPVFESVSASDAVGTVADVNTEAPEAEEAVVLSPLEDILPVEEVAVAGESDAIEPESDLVDEPAEEEPTIDGTEEDACWVSSEVFCVNPLYESEVSAWEMEPLDGAAEYEVPGTYASLVEAAAVLREQMKARRTDFVFEYINPDYLTEDEVSVFFDEILELAVSHTGDPKEGDYLLWHYRWYNYYYNCRYDKENSCYNYEIHCSFSYNSTSAQEAAMDSAVDDLLRSLNVSGLSDYAKISAVYDYICENVKYDYKTTSDIKYTAYAALVNGKSVCQGYALLLYRLALELGVDCRIIPGTANGDSHRWDIVQLNGVYYNLDPTYDAGENTYGYFLVCDKNMKNHSRAAKYNTSTFRTSYPVAEEDFDLDAASSTDINWDSIVWKNTNGELNVSGTGPIPDCESASQTPWAKEDYSSVVISGNLTAIGTNNFDGTGIDKAVVDENITSIGEKAFAGCTDLGCIYIMNDACEIFDAADTLGNPETTVIYGYYTSTAKDYANKYGYEFVDMGFSNRTVTVNVTTANSAEEPIVRLYNASATDLEIYEDMAKEESEKAEHAVVSVSDETLRNDGLYGHLVTLQDVEPGRYKLAFYIPNLYVTRVEYINVSGDMALGDRHMWIYGDVDNNGVFDARDATQITRYVNVLDSIFGSSGNNDAELMRRSAADSNQDGICSEEDAATVLRLIISSTLVNQN